MAPKPLFGIMVAIITPLKADGSLDHEALHAHINRMLDAGVHGFVPGGSTGEFATLSLDERKELMESVIKGVADRAPVCAGIGALNTAEALDLARHHAKIGADALMVLPPFYEPPGKDELRSYLKDIHDETGLPLLYYNIPSITGQKLGPQDLANLHDVGVKYLKDTSGDGPALTELLFGQDKIIPFNGWDTLTFYGLAAGAQGSVWGATNFIPELSVALWNALAVEKDIQKGRELWKKIWPIVNHLDTHTYYSASIKKGMELRGWQAGGVRKPWSLVDQEFTKVLTGYLNSAGVKTV